MKKVLSLVLTVLFVGTVSAQGSKLAHVDFEKVVTMMAIKDKVTEKLQQTAKELEDIFTKDQDRYSKELQEYMSQRGSMTEMMRQSREEQLQRRQQELQESQQRYSQILQEQQGKLLQPIIEMVNKEVERVSKVEGFAYVLDSGTIVYAGGKDLTDMLIKSLGLESIKIPAGGGSLPGGSDGLGY